MAESKEERENRFIKDWNSGMTEKDLAKKYKMSVGAVKSWKSHIRAHDLYLYKGELRKTKLTRKTFLQSYKETDKTTHKKKEEK